jgi:hypothetical protein
MAVMSVRVCSPALVRLSAGVSAIVVATVLVAAPASAADTRTERLNTRVYVIDFDPLMDDLVPLTVARGWNDPFALDEHYRADVMSASAGVVHQQIARTSVVRTYPVKPGGFTFTNAQYVGCLADSSPAYCSALIDYAQVLNTSYDPAIGSACEALQRSRVDEVWLWGGPWFGYLEYLEVAAHAACPKVSKPFVVMGFSYERTVGEMLHDLGHRAENMVRAGIGATWWDRFDGQRARYSQDFACPSQPDAGHPEVDADNAHAGNVHFPPNAYCHYQYDRDHPVLSDADDWANFPDLTGRRTVVNADTWGATQEGFLIWWLGRFPRRPGNSDGIFRDWWRYVFPGANHGKPTPEQLG